MSYIDTSVIVAALDPLDPRQKRAREALEKEEYKVISELAIAELASVLARREEVVSNIVSELGLDKREAILAILLYLLQRFNLRYRSTQGHTRLPLLGRVHKPIATALELAPTLTLRTLDLLHVAYAKLLQEEGEPIQKLVTADHGFEKAREKLREAVGIDVHII